MTDQTNISPVKTSNLPDNCPMTDCYLQPCTGKSEAMILTHKPFSGPLKPVMLGNKVLDFVTETKCLGIIIDNQLSWLSHIELLNL